MDSFFTLRLARLYDSDVEMADPAASLDDAKWASQPPVSSVSRPISPGFEREEVPRHLFDSSLASKDLNELFGCNDTLPSPRSVASVVAPGSPRKRSDRALVLVRVVENGVPINNDVFKAKVCMTTRLDDMAQMIADHITRAMASEATPQQAPSVVFSLNEYRWIKTCDDCCTPVIWMNAQIRLSPPVKSDVPPERTRAVENYR